MAANLPESFQLIFHDSPLGVAVILGTHAETFENALLLYANPALLTLMEEWQPERFDLANLVADLCTNHDNESLLPLPVDTGIEQSIITKLKISSGIERWLEIRAQPTTILGEKGHFFWFNDITTTKQKEMSALNEAKMADEAAQAKSNFLATMSHEIRTPLQTIFGMLELLSIESPTAAQAEMLGAAKISANGLLEILDDILDLAKVEAGKMELDLFELPIRTLVYGITEAMEAKRREHHIYLSVEIDDNVPPVFVGDPKRLRQIITNLLGNALKFTEKGGIIIRVSNDVSEITPPENEIGLRFEIQDTGIGMTSETANKLFQPFAQGDNSTTRRFGGTGLGLSIAQRLVELMEGKIGVTSIEGRGSTFWFEIPVSTAADDIEMALQDLRGLTILSIEDHPRSAKEIQSSLQSMGAVVTSVGTAAEGIALAAKRPFDVAIVDYGLPDASGTDVLKKLNQIRPFMGLILYTVHDDYDVKQICKYLGAKYLSKPSSRLYLGEAVKGAAKQISHLLESGPRRLLICEDNPTVRDIFRRQLEIIGVEADYAFDGQEGWEILQKNQHGIVITDLHMPRMDGYGLAKMINDSEKTGSKHIPVIVMTADIQLVHEQSYLKHGFDECLLKPVSLGQIRQLLIRWGLLEESEHIGAEPGLEHMGSAGTSVIDRKLAIEQFGAFDAGAIEMIHLFVDLSETQIADMHDAYHHKDWTRLKNLAHSLKGAARSACCAQLGDVAELIQEQSGNGNVDEENFVRLPFAFDAVKHELTKLIPLSGIPGNRP